FPGPVTLCRSRRQRKGSDEGASLACAALFVRQVLERNAFTRPDSGDYLCGISAAPAQLDVSFLEVAAFAYIHDRMPVMLKNGPHGHYDRIGNTVHLNPGVCLHSRTYP